MAKQLLLMQKVPSSNPWHRHWNGSISEWFEKPPPESLSGVPLSIRINYLPGQGTDSVLGYLMWKKISWPLERYPRIVKLLWTRQLCPCLLMMEMKFLIEPGSSIMPVIMTLGIHNPSKSGIVNVHEWQLLVRRVASCRRRGTKNCSKCWSF